MKFASLRATRRYWITGVAAALIGILLARAVAPQFSGRSKTLVNVAGQLMAMGGLIVIAFGISRRGSTSEEDAPQ